MATRSDVAVQQLANAMYPTLSRPTVFRIARELGTYHDGNRTMIRFEILAAFVGEDAAEIAGRAPLKISDTHVTPMKERMRALILASERPR